MIAVVSFVIGVYAIALAVILLLIQGYGSVIDTAQAADDVVDAYAAGKQLAEAKQQGWRFNND